MTKKLSDKIFEKKDQFKTLVNKFDPNNYTDDDKVKFINMIYKLESEIKGYIECCEDIGYLEPEAHYYENIMIDLYKSTDLLKKLDYII